MSSPAPAPVRDQEPGAQVPEYLTVDQVAAMLQVGNKSVYRWLKGDPTMPALKIGGTVRLPRERLLRWLQQREQGAARSRRAAAAVSRPTPGQEVGA